MDAVYIKAPDLPTTLIDPEEDWGEWDLCCDCGVCHSCLWARCKQEEAEWQAQALANRQWDFLINLICACAVLLVLALVLSPRARGGPGIAQPGVVGSTPAARDQWARPP